MSLDPLETCYGLSLNLPSKLFKLRKNYKERPTGCSFFGVRVGSPKMRFSMSKFLIVLALISSFSAQALSVDFSLKLSQSGEYSELTKEDLELAGCDVVENDYDEMTCVIAKVIDDKDLPLNISVGEASLSISKDGVIHLGISVGDADSSAFGSLTLPTDDNGNLLALPAPLKLEVSGAENASGAWSFNSSLSIMVD